MSPWPWCTLAAVTCGVLGGYLGGVYRVGTGEGYTGVLPSYLESGGPDSEAGPGALQGRSGWSGVQRPPVQPQTHPPGPVGPLQGPPWSGPSLPASWPIRATFHLFYCKVSQNDEVSTKFDEKACHSPYFQNGLGSSPLDFLRFPFLLAFSDKELMVPF